MRSFRWGAAGVQRIARGAWEGLKFDCEASLMRRDLVESVRARRQPPLPSLRSARFSVNRTDRRVRFRWKSGFDVPLRRASDAQGNVLAPSAPVSAGLFLKNLAPNRRVMRRQTGYARLRAGRDKLFSKMPAGPKAVRKSPLSESEHCIIWRHFCRIYEQKVGGADSIFQSKRIWARR